MTWREHLIISKFRNSTQQLWSALALALLLDNHMGTIDETQAQLNTHEEVCAFRYDSICARLKRLESIGIGACGTIIVLLVGILLNLVQKGAA